MSVAQALKPHAGRGVPRPQCYDADVTAQIEAQRKPCSTCRVVKPMAAFNLDLKRRDGRFGECRECQKVRYRAWYAARRAAQIEKDRERARVATAKRRVREDPRYQFWKSARWRARKLGVEFTIGLEDIAIPERCPVLGIELVSGMGRGFGHDLCFRDRAPSLDRIDNSRGYTPDNVVVVSYRANRIKSDAAVAELEAVASFYRQLANRAEGGR